MRTEVKFVSTLMNQIGIPIDDISSSRSFYQRAIVLIALLGMQLQTAAYIFVNRKEFSTLPIGVSFSALEFSLTSTYLHLLYQSSSAKKLLTNIDWNMFTYPDDSKIQPKYGWLLQERNINRVLVGLLVYMSIFSILLQTLPPLIAVIRTGETEMLIIPAWDPFHSAMISYILQVAMFSVGFVVYYTIQAYLYLVTVEFVRQAKRLREAIGSVHLRAENHALEETRVRECFSGVSKLNAAGVCCGGTYRGGEVYEKFYRRNIADNVVQNVKHFQALVK